MVRSSLPTLFHSSGNDGAIEGSLRQMCVNRLIDGIQWATVVAPWQKEQRHINHSPCCLNRVTRPPTRCPRRLDDDEPGGRHYAVDSGGLMN